MTATSPQTAITVDLDTGAITSLPSTGWAKRAGLGGRGYNSLTMFAHSEGGDSDERSDEGPLLLSCGALTGTSAPSSSAVPEDDTLAGYFIDTPVHSGPSAGSQVDLAPMLAEFYTLMGWTPRGYPTREKLDALELL